MFLEREDAVDRFVQNFNSDGQGNYSFQLKEFPLSVPVTEDEFVDAEMRFRLLSKIAMAITWVLTLGAAGWLYYKLLNDSFSVSFWAALPAAFAGGVIANGAAISASLRPFKRRLREALVEQARAEGSEEAYAAAFKHLPTFRAYAFPLGFLGLVFLVSSYFALTEHTRRVNVLSAGHEVEAQVTRSEANGRRNLCVVEYTFNWNGSAFVGETIDCPTMKAHPVGSTLSVKFDPADPGGSLALNESTWSHDSALPMMIGPLLLLILICLLLA
jgi:hypothetical protein